MEQIDLGRVKWDTQEIDLNKVKWDEPTIDLKKVQWDNEPNLSNQMLDDTYVSPDQFKGTMANLEKYINPQKVYDGVKAMAEMGAGAVRDTVTQNPYKTIEQITGGVGNSANELSALLTKALTPTGNILTNAYNNLADSNYTNPLPEITKKIQENIGTFHNKSESKPISEVSNMLTSPVNALFSGGGGVLKSMGVGSLLPTYQQAVTDKPSTVEDSIASGLTIGALHGITSGAKGAYDKTKEIVKPKEIQPQEQAQGLTANEAEVAQNLAKQFEQAKPETPTVAENAQVQQGKSLDEQMELIRTHDRGGEEQAQTYKAQMQSWADRENANRVEQGLEPTVTADDMARQNFINYENKARPTEAELNTLFETATDANGNFKTIGDRNKSHGWQDTQNTDAYGQEYTTRMAGERGLDSEVTTPVSTLKKLKEEGYNALSDAERAMVDRDIDTIRNHPDFKTLEQTDGTRLNESGELVDADGNYLFQTNDLSFKDKIKEIKNNLGLESFSVYEGEKDITLTMIKVPKDKQKQGLGTKAINELIKIADEKGKRVVLTTGTRDDIHGTTSKNRLISFYKKFGFVENKGRNKDWSIIENMYREPLAPYQQKPKDTNTLFQSAYHGTPHNVDKFSTDKIGTGEGAQAYGHGLYFADSKEVAEFYKKELSGADKIAINGEVIRNQYGTEANTIRLILKNVKNKKMSFEQAKKEAIYDLQIGKVPSDLEFAKQLETIQEKDISENSAGNLYKVDLKPKEEEYLQWDKPLSEQSLHVKEKLKRLVLDDSNSGGKTKFLIRQFNEGNLDRIYPRELMEALGNGNYESRLASEKLDSLGIKGVKYLDNNSRAKGDGNHNYVIFNDKDVEVIGANGKHYDPSIPDTLFQGEKYPQGVKGAYSIDSKLIQIFESHDISTLNHELGHRFLHTLSEKEFSVASEIFGVKDGKWTREQHEAFADAYARYIAEGKTPVKGLKAIFDKFKEFTKNILLALKENNGGKMPKLSPEMKEFFSATLGHEPSRAKLFERIKEKESKADIGDGTLYQTASQKEHLKEVYKDSHPLTKNEDGTPKVFYHGSPYDISSFKNGNYDFIYFTESPKYAERYAFGNDKVGGIYPVYIKANKIFDTRNPKDRAIFEKEFYMKYGNATKLDTKTGLPDWVEAKELKEFFEDKGYNYDGVMLSENPDNVGNGISLGVVSPTQIKSIHNKPLSEGKSPDFENSNILYQLPQNLLATPQRPNFGNDKKNMQWATEKIKSVVSSATESLRDMTPDFYKELSSDRHTGISNITDRAELIHKGLLNLSPETNKILQQAIVGDSSLPKGYELLQPLVDGINREIKAYSKILVNEGMLDKDTALAYEKYLKRSYANHWEEAGNIQGGNDKGVKKIISRGKEVSTKDAEEVYNFVDDYLLANGKQDLGTQMDIADIKQHLIDEGLIGSSIVDGKITWKEDGAGNISLHRDWTKAERESMGEIENASVTVPHTLLSMGMMIQNAKFMKELSLTAKTFKNIDEAQANGYDQVPNSPRYGASAGLYLDKHIVSDIKYAYEQSGVVWQGYQKALSIWKQGKTVFNPASHVNNFLGNITAQMLMGRTLKETTSMLGETAKQVVEFNSKVPRYKELVTKDFVGMLDAKEKAELATLKTDLKYYIEGKENGLFGRGQIHDLLKGFNAQTNSFNGKGIIQKGLEKVQDTYGTGDNIPRLASYKVLRENGMSVKDAKAFVTELFPDYTKPLPPAFRALRDSGLSPFIAWSYYVLPNIWKLAKLHPARAISILGLAYALPAIISGKNPFGEEMPDKEKGRRVPISKDGTTLKIDRFLPGFDFASVPMDMGNQLISNGMKGNLGKGVNNAISAGARDVGKLAQDYLAGGFAKLPIELANNKNLYTGKSISGDTQDASKQTYNYLKHIAGTLAPAPLANLGGIAENTINPKMKKAHSEVVPRTNTQELLKILGINTMTYDSNEVKRNRILEEMKYLKGK